MKRKLQVLFLALLLVGCSGTKRNTKLNINNKMAINTNVSKKEETNTEISLTDKSGRQSSKSADSSEDKNKVTEIIVTVFDTDKAIDPGTGKPPVKSETKTTQRTEARTNNKTVESTSQQNDIKADYKQLLKQALDSAMVANSNLIDKSQSKETATNNSWWKWFIGGIGVAVVSYTVVWAVYKKPWRIVSF